MYHDLTEGKISRSLLLFALPMMAGNLLQQRKITAFTSKADRIDDPETV